MSLARFVESLLTGGQVKASHAVDAAGRLYRPASAELDDTAAILVAFEADYRDSLAGNPPRLNLPAMMWGANIAFRACAFLIQRDQEEKVMRAALEEACPEAPSPAVCYSVDLTLRFLPDFVRLAKATSPTDPLVVVLKTLGSQWPLSSVGITELDACDPEPFLSDRCLRMLYVDRIIAAKDRSRVEHPVVRDAIQSAVGIHHELGFALEQKS